MSFSQHLKDPMELFTVLALIKTPSPLFKYYSRVHRQIRSNTLYSMSRLLSSRISAYIYYSNANPFY